MFQNLTMNLLEFYITIFFILMILFFKFMKNLISSLILLELFFSILILIISYSLSNLSMNFSLLMVFSVLGVLETCLGLSFLINFTRFWGSDLLTHLKLAN